MPTTAEEVAEEFDRLHLEPATARQQAENERLTVERAKLETLVARKRAVLALALQKNDNKSC